MSYYETVEDIEESEGEEVEEESDVEEEVVPKRRKQKKWKVRTFDRVKASGIANEKWTKIDEFDFTDMTMVVLSIAIRIPISPREPCRLSSATRRPSVQT